MKNSAIIIALAAMLILAAITPLSAAGQAGKLRILYIGSINGYLKLCG